MWDALAVAFVWGFERLAFVVIRRMTGFRYSLLPFDDSLASVEILHDVSEEQNSCILHSDLSQKLYIFQTSILKTAKTVLLAFTLITMPTNY